METWRDTSRPLMSSPVQRGNTSGVKHGDDTTTAASGPRSTHLPGGGGELLVGLVAGVLEMPIVVLSLVDGGGQWCEAPRGLALGGLVLDDTFSGQVARDGASCVVFDTETDVRLSGHPLVTGAPHIRFYAGFPLYAADGVVLGSLCIFDTHSRSPGPPVLATMAMLCRYLSGRLAFERDGRLAAAHGHSMGSLQKAASDTIVIFDERGRIEHVNAAGERDFGYTAAEFQGLRLDALFPEAPLQEFGAWLRTGAGRARQLRATRRDATTFPVEAVFNELTIGSRTMFTGLILDATARRAEARRVKAVLASRRSDIMLGDSAVVSDVIDQVEQVSRGDWSVLIEGETGAGKERSAHAVHALSARRGAPFLTVNCAALTDSLLTTQLFGHVKGSFTGATHDKPGIFESAAGGTVFLDEIGELSPLAQGALLRVLQEKEVTRVGESVSRKIDVRIITATNRDLNKLVAVGAFRADLLYRIRGARIRVPALRERREDIPLLIAAFLAEHPTLPGGALHISDEAVACMVGYDWPGNVRELRAAVDHLMIRSRAGHAEWTDLPPELLADRPPSSPPVVHATDERTRIVEALRKTGGNRARAAQRIGVARATLYRRMKVLGIVRTTEQDA